MSESDICQEENKTRYKGEWWDVLFFPECSGKSSKLGEVSTDS